MSETKLNHDFTAEFQGSMDRLFFSEKELLDDTSEDSKTPNSRSARVFDGMISDIGFVINYISENKVDSSELEKAYPGFDRLLETFDKGCEDFRTDNNVRALKDIWHLYNCWTAD